MADTSTTEALTDQAANAWDQIYSAICHVGSSNTGDREREAIATARKAFHDFKDAALAQQAATPAVLFDMRALCELALKADFAFPPTPPGIVKHHELGELCDRLQLQQYGLRVAEAMLRAAIVATPQPPAAQAPDEALRLAIRFHETYERLAPQFGYETRADTRTFDPDSKNGRLMVAVCTALSQAVPQSGGLSDAEDAARWRWWRQRWAALCRMEVAASVGLDLSRIHVTNANDMDAVTDAARAGAVEGGR